MSEENADRPSSPAGPGDVADQTRSFEHAPGSFETVGPPPSAPPGQRRRGLLAVVVLVLALVAGGAYAAYAFLDGGGAQPADVLPSSTVAVVSVDLDPSASQKIAAIKSIRKFPALKKSLGLHADDDLREFAFDKLVEKAHCGDLSFDHDVKPWLGKRAAFAAVDLGEPNPSPVIALQISDKDKARKGFQAVVDCTDPDDFAFALGDDYLVASDSPAHARAVLDQGARKPLADDAAYRRWTDEAGDRGVLNFYVGPGARTYAERLLDDFAGSVFGDRDGVGLEGDDSSSEGSADPLSTAKDALHDFKGLAGAVRFSGGGMELAVAGGGVRQATGLATVGAEVGDLPEDTAVAAGLGFGKDFAKRVTDRLSSDDLASAEDETGLNLPDDLQTLLGRAVTLSVGGAAPDSLEQLSRPEDVSAGLVLHGDAEKIRALIATLEDHFGVHLSDLPVDVDSSGDAVALSTGGYGTTLLQDGRLGSSERFRNAVPDADKASGVLYVDFNSKWRETLLQALAGSDDSSELDQNTRPLRSLGLSSWQDGDVSHALLKVTTD